MSGIGRMTKESDRYREIRDRVQQAEVALRDQRERVAALRRELPLDTEFADQDLEEISDGQRVKVRLSQVFENPAKPLVLMHFMYGKKQISPCPLCTAWADGYNGVAGHLGQLVNFAVLVAGDVGSFAEYARGRGWGSLRLLSAADSSLKRDLGFETEDGAQHPGVSVFTLADDGSLRHFYSQSAVLGTNEFRGMDLLSPIWHFLDVTPDGRGEFFPKKSY